MTLHYPAERPRKEVLAKVRRKYLHLNRRRQFGRINQTMTVVEYCGRCWDNEVMIRAAADCVHIRLPAARAACVVLPGKMKVKDLIFDTGSVVV